jgi:hypothetical protein
LCWQTVEQQFIPALAIASSVSGKREKKKTEAYDINHFKQKIHETNAFS